MCQDVPIDHGRVDGGYDGMSRVQEDSIKPMVFLATVPISGADPGTLTGRA